MQIELSFFICAELRFFFYYLQIYFSCCCGITYFQSGTWLKSSPNHRQSNDIEHVHELREFDGSTDCHRCFHEPFQLSLARTFKNSEQFQSYFSYKDSWNFFFHRGDSIKLSFIVRVSPNNCHRLLIYLKALDSFSYQITKCRALMNNILSCRFHWQSIGPRSKWMELRVDYLMSKFV